MPEVSISGLITEWARVSRSTVPADIHRARDIGNRMAAALESGTVLTEPERDAAFKELQASTEDQSAATENERKALEGALTNVLSNASNYPEKVQSRILGQNMGPLNAKVADAVLARGFRLPIRVELTDDVVERAAQAMFEDPWLPAECSWAEVVAEDPGRADIWRGDARRVLAAAGFRGAVQVETTEALAGLAVAMMGTTDGGMISPDSEIPAGEMYRLASEYIASLMLLLVVPVEPEWEYMVRSKIAGSNDTFDIAATDEETCNAIIAMGVEGIDRLVMRRRKVGPWLPVEPLSVGQVV